MLLASYTSQRIPSGFGGWSVRHPPIGHWRFRPTLSSLAQSWSLAQGHSRCPVAILDQVLVGPWESLGVCVGISSSTLLVIPFFPGCWYFFKVAGGRMSTPVACHQHRTNSPELYTLLLESWSTHPHSINAFLWIPF